MYGQSSVRLVDLQTGSVIREHKMDSTDFGEGLTKLGDTCAPSPQWTPYCMHLLLSVDICAVSVSFPFVMVRGTCILMEVRFK